MTTPSLKRVKILKFMLSRIGEPLTLDEISDGSNTTLKNVISETNNLKEDRMITQTSNGFKLSFANAQFIVSNHTDLAVVCDFEKILKKRINDV